MRPIDIERFWIKVKKDDANGCWIWIGCTNGRYGQQMIGRKHWFAHRVSWVIHYGEIPDGLLVCHHCDNPLCIRPSHLFLGTQTENMRDAANKGRVNISRHAYGENCGTSKLTVNKVREIRKAHENGINYANLSKQYFVSANQIRQIVLKRNWKEVDDVLV